MSENNTSSVEYPIASTWVASQGFNSLIANGRYLVVLGIVFAAVLALNKVVLTGYNVAASTQAASPFGTFETVLFWVFVAYIVFAAFRIVRRIAVCLLWKPGFYFELQDQNILVRGGVVSRAEEHLPYRAIQDVIVTQSVGERFFGIAHVTLQNAARSGPGVVIPGQPLARAKALGDAIRARLLNGGSSTENALL